MADIAFLLLIFFLVVTQIPKEEGITTTLPAMSTVASPTAVKELDVWLNAQDQVMVNGELVPLTNTARKIYRLIRHDPVGTRVSVKSHEGASYNAYVNLYAAIKDAYMLLYDEEARVTYKRGFNELPAMERELIRNKIPPRVMEADLVHEN